MQTQSQPMQTQSQPMQTQSQPMQTPQTMQPMQNNKPKILKIGQDTNLDNNVVINIKENQNQINKKVNFSDKIENINSNEINNDFLSLLKRKSENNIIELNENINNNNNNNNNNQDELIKMQNNDLTQQLRNLETIQSNIENKNVIINQINYNMSLQQKNIMILIVSILFGLLLLGNIIAYGYGYINYSRYIYIIIGLIILYICFIIYQFDIFYVKSALTAIFNRNLPQRLDKSVTDLQNYIKDNIEFDQLIYEFGDDKEPSWVHVSYESTGKQRKQVLRATKVNGKTTYAPYK
jgi:hypothetical protein